MLRTFFELAALVVIALGLYIGAAIGLYSFAPWMGWTVAGVATGIFIVRLNWLRSSGSGGP